MLRNLASVCNQKAYILKRVVIAVVLIFCVIYSLHPGRFACYYSYINDDEIVSSLGISPAAVKMAEDYGMPLCSVTFNSSVTEVHYPAQKTDLNDGTVFAKTLNITDGGEWKPQKCVSKFSVAVVVPYRNRSSQLQIFLKYMHPFLQNQLLSYQIFVVEQALDGAFNRAKLLNIGFVEAMKIRPFHCFIFHDVDLIPQKDNNIYACTSQPRHMSSCVNTFRYHLPYEELFGGAVAILQNQFELVNGFSNNFYGWGGEDDDFHRRITHKGLKVLRFSPNVAQYFMLPHAKEPPSESRFLNLKLGSERFETDGLNALKYTLLKRIYLPLYTWILVEV
ncbi:beta-1,4-N-acetylgalactosaminyltransferase bre-4-like [Schistocerca cancellata]|uniref:beta-1,4-N-acetylgalactosaminyltransferase bre-4-like n=1 Tax=Schistocerca cancellata TaxID=274614 RepID=UPI002119AEFD|nr:beta-1,4-N-acetylgalactosaminyltransferase bre-4-like [Schistocerca cancellata]